jgi:hypothetical protein
LLLARAAAAAAPSVVVCIAIVILVAPVFIPLQDRPDTIIQHEKSNKGCA